MKRRGGGKGKGSAFEREVCKKLSLWVSGGAREDLYWRAAMSGGRATLGHRKGKDLRYQAGDISCQHPDGHKLTDKFYVECKFYRDLNLDAVFFGKGRLFKFWQETEAGAAKHKRLPLLIAKQNHTPILVLTDAGQFDLRELPFAQVEIMDAYNNGWSVDMVQLKDLLRKDFDTIVLPE